MLVILLLTIHTFAKETINYFSLWQLKVQNSYTIIFLED